MSDSPLTFEFPSVGGKQVSARFDGGDITSDAGFVLVAEADRKISLTGAIAAAISDKRQAAKVSFDMETLIKERVFAIATGYEDANDLDTLRGDPALKLACGRTPKTDRDLASQPTLSRLENALSAKDLFRMAVALAERVVAQLPEDTTSVILDIDEMEDPCHGQQELEFFNGHYGSYCYLPLLLFVTDQTGRQRLMTVALREGKTNTRGARSLIKRAVGMIRARFPRVRIELRADALYGNSQVLSCCDKLGIEFTLGLASNVRLHEETLAIQMDACIKYSQLKYIPGFCECKEYAAFDYQAGPWDRKRTVIIKAEITQAQVGQLKVNPRFIVTNREYARAEDGYIHYCQRGDIENRIKEFNLDLSGGRTSCHRFLANQCRVLLHAAASVLMSVVQEAAQATALCNSQMGTLRLQVLKLGARICETARRVWIHMSSSYPNQRTWQTIYEALSG